MEGKGVHDWKYSWVKSLGSWVQDFSGKRSPSELPEEKVFGKRKRDTQDRKETKLNA